MKKILVVDDDKLMLDSLAKTLTDHGYQVFQAKDGEEGFLVAQSSQPDLILTDIKMPKLDGHAMLEKIRKTDWGKNIIAVILTIKDSDIEGVNKSMQVGVAAYLSKADISREQVLSVVDQQLQNT